MSSQPGKPTPEEDKRESPGAADEADEEPGSNAVEHEPDPQAKPIPDGAHKYVPRSPYTTGND
jgi:hypothetical protein